MNSIEKIESINKVSPSFCLAKWLQVTIDLTRGTNHSCHHPQKHIIPLAELQNNISALHNTEYKKQQRKMMRSGQRPPECSFCWAAEDTQGDHISDRLIKSLDDWAYNELPYVIDNPWDFNINPTYVEVMFNDTCNFSCSYCMADVSSNIWQEMKKFGPIDVSNPMHRMPQSGVDKIPAESNPYIEAFWQWFPDLLKKLKVFRVTGGEPLLDSNIFKVFDYLNKNPQPELTLALNSNLGVSDKLIDRSLEDISNLCKNNKIKNFELYASIDTYGGQAEYTRFGLNYNKFISNIEKFCSTFPQNKIILMCTYNILSVPHFNLLLRDVLRLKKKYFNLIFDISRLANPKYLCADLVDTSMYNIIEKDLGFMQQNHCKDFSTGFSDHEINKMKAVYHHVKTATSPDREQNLRDFHSFIDEYDKRKNINFRETFPEFINFYNEIEQSKKTTS